MDILYIKNKKKHLNRQGREGEGERESEKKNLKLYPRMRQWEQPHVTVVVLSDIGA